VILAYVLYLLEHGSFACYYAAYYFTSTSTLPLPPLDYLRIFWYDHIGNIPVYSQYAMRIQTEKAIDFGRWRTLQRAKNTNLCNCGKCDVYRGSTTSCRTWFGE
jgi:hypothetical protein